MEPGGQPLPSGALPAQQGSKGPADPLLGQGGPAPPPAEPFAQDGGHPLFGQHGPGLGLGHLALAAAHRFPGPRFEQVHALFQPEQPDPEILEDAVLGQGEDLLAALLDGKADGLPGPADEVVDAVGEGLFLFHDHLGGGRGSRGPDVGDEVGDGEIDLVADGRDDRDGRAGDGPGHPLLVEGPEVLDRSAAPADDEDVDVGQGAQVVDAGDDLVGRPVALDAGRVDEDVELGEAPLQGPQDVDDGRPGGRGDDADLLGQEGSLRLRAGSKRPSALSFSFNCSKASWRAPLPLGSTRSMMSW